MEEYATERDLIKMVFVSLVRNSKGSRTCIDRTRKKKVVGGTRKCMMNGLTTWNEK